MLVQKEVNLRLRAATFLRIRLPSYWSMAGGATIVILQYQPKSPDTLVKQVTKSNVFPNSFGITLDGHPLTLTNEEASKVQSDLYNFTLPAKNIWGEPAGPDKGIAQGWYVFLKPLSAGYTFYTTPRATEIQGVIQLFRLDKATMLRIYKT